MAIQTESLEVVGKLMLDNLEFEMLQVEPVVRTVPWHMKESGIQSFYVIGGDGFAKNIFVKGSFVIEPLIESHVKEVKFLIEEVTDTDTSAETISAQ